VQNRGDLSAADSGAATLSIGTESAFGAGFYSEEVFGLVTARNPERSFTVPSTRLR